MDTEIPQRRDYGFVIGLLTGTFVGAGLVAWLAPRGTAELGDRMAESARRFGKRAADQARDASGRVADAADELVRKGNGVRDRSRGLGRPRCP